MAVYVNHAARWLERALTIVGVLCLGWYGYVSVEAAHFQREQAAAFERLVDTAAIAPATPSGAAAPSEPTASSTAAVLPSAPDFPTAPDFPAFPATTDFIGMLDIPRLRISTAVMSGDDDQTLEVAVGHLPDTPRPWEPGNSAVAAHRDGLFRPLKDIRVGDALTVRTTRGDIHYQVRELKVVTPDDLSVLEPTSTQTLTLITCYPFNYIGAAPKRFIVRAERITDGTH